MKRATPARERRTLVFSAATAIGLVLSVGLFALATSRSSQLAAAGLAGPAWFVVVVILALASAGFLFGALESTGELHGETAGLTFRFGGPAALAVVIVVLGLKIAPSQDFMYQGRVAGVAGDALDAGSLQARVTVSNRTFPAAVNSDGDFFLPGLPRSVFGAHGTVEFYRAKTRLEATPKSVTLSNEIQTFTLTAPQQTPGLDNHYVRVKQSEAKNFFCKNPSLFDTTLGQPLVIQDAAFADLKERTLHPPPTGRDFESFDLLSIDNRSGTALSGLVLTDGSGQRIGQIGYLPDQRSVLAIVAIHSEAKPFQRVIAAVSGGPTGKPVRLALRPAPDTPDAYVWTGTNEVGLGYPPDRKQDGAGDPERNSASKTDCGGVNLTRFRPHRMAP